MFRRDSGPRRSGSVDAYLRGTRALAAVALLALVSGVLWDALDGRFWARHALLAGLVASVIVVMLTVALVNEALERRSRAVDLRAYRCHDDNKNAGERTRTSKAVRPPAPKAGVSTSSTTPAGITGRLARTRRPRELVSSIRDVSFVT
jgi:hypothetical protein